MGIGNYTEDRGRKREREREREKERERERERERDSVYVCGKIHQTETAVNFVDNCESIVILLFFWKFSLQY